MSLDRLDKIFFFFQAEDGIRDAQESRGLGVCIRDRSGCRRGDRTRSPTTGVSSSGRWGCLLYTSDAADDLTRVDIGGGCIFKKKKAGLHGPASVSSTRPPSATKKST